MGEGAVWFILEHHLWPILLLYLCDFISRSHIYSLNCYKLQVNHIFSLRAEGRGVLSVASSLCILCMSQNVFLDMSTEMLFIFIR